MHSSRPPPPPTAMAIISVGVKNDDFPSPDDCGAGIDVAIAFVVTVEESVVAACIVVVLCSIPVVDQVVLPVSTDVDKVVPLLKVEDLQVNYSNCPGATNYSREHCRTRLCTCCCHTICC
jgi:hypothetical protein